MPSVSVFKQSSIIFGLKWLLIPLDFVTGALVARAVGPEGKGVLLLLGGLAGAIMSFANLGTPYGAIYLYKKEGYPLGQIVAAGFLLTIVPTCLALLGFALLSESFVRIFMGTADAANFQRAWLLFPLASSLIHMLFSVGDTLIIRDNEMKLYGIKVTGPPLIRIALTLLLAIALGWGIIGVLGSELLAKMIGVGVPIYWFAKKGAFGSLRLSLNATKEMLRIGLQRYAITMVTMISKRFDAFLIAGLLSVQQVGFFSIAWGALNIFKTFPSATMWPLVSKLVSKDEDKLSQFARVSRIQFMLMMILAVLFAPLVPLLINIVYGKAFLPATGAVWLILPGIFTIPFITSGHAYFTSKGQPGRILIPFIFSTLMQVGISLTLVPQIGVLGGAIGVSANNISLSAMLIFLIVRDGGPRASEMIIMSRKDWSTLYGLVKKLLSRKSIKALAYWKSP